MAGVSDRAFRRLCRAWGAAATTTEMAATDPRFWRGAEVKRRLHLADDPSPIVQLIGTDPEAMATAARVAVDAGATTIDLNFGCPAKRVCRQAAGSALLQTPERVFAIAEAVVRAVAVPVTAKIRTGWHRDHRNAVAVAQGLAAVGIRRLVVHGRTRADGYQGPAEYETIRQVVAQTSVPVVANGDIDSPQKALHVLQQTGAAGLMVGRAALTRPWLFWQIDGVWRGDGSRETPEFGLVIHRLLPYLELLYSDFGTLGVLRARKVLRGLAELHPDGDRWWQQLTRLEEPQAQYRWVAASETA